MKHPTTSSRSPEEIEAELRTTRSALETSIARLRELTKDSIMQTLAMYSSSAPVTPKMSREEARQEMMSHLLSAKEIPIHKVVCRHLVTVGFPESAITYREEKGERLGFVAGIPLLKFVGLVHEDAPTLDEIEPFLEMGEDATMH